MVRGMRIVVIGATGTIGSAVADALADRHEVVRASRNGPARVDVDDGASVDAFFAEVKNIDAVVSCATGTPARWQALFGPLDKLGEAQLTSLLDGLGAHVRFLLACCRHVVDGGSITVTTGALAHQPIPGSAAVTMMAAGLEGFVRGAALDMPRGVRFWYCSGVSAVTARKCRWNEVVLIPASRATSSMRSAWR